MKQSPVKKLNPTEREVKSLVEYAIISASASGKHANLAKEIEVIESTEYPRSIKDLAIKQVKQNIAEIEENKPTSWIDDLKKDRTDALRRASEANKAGKDFDHGFNAGRAQVLDSWIASAMITKIARGEE